MQWNRRRGWRWRWGRIWLAGWAGGVQGELCGGAESPPEIWLWQSEVWSVCKITGKVTYNEILTSLMKMISQSFWVDLFESYKWSWDGGLSDRRNCAMWPMSRTQKERRQQRGGRHGWTQRHLLFLLTITCEFIKAKTSFTLKQSFFLPWAVSNIYLSLQGWFVWGWWDKGAAEVQALVGKAESFYTAGGTSWWVQVIPS